MTAATLYGLCAAVLIGLGLHGVVAGGTVVRRIVALNVVGAGTFLLFGVVARRGGEAGLPSDPVPQAMVITGIVVAFAATALAATLAQRLAELERADGAEASADDNGERDR